MEPAQYGAPYCRHLRESENEVSVGMDALLLIHSPAIT
jgi:hypothetical protein